MSEHLWASRRWVRLMSVLLLFRAERFESDAIERCCSMCRKCFREKRCKLRKPQRANFCNYVDRTKTILKEHLSVRVFKLYICNWDWQVFISKLFCILYVSFFFFFFDDAHVILPSRGSAKLRQLRPTVLIRACCHSVAVGFNWATIQFLVKD